ncbi:formate dehydrogenase accessory sulfurtransferase FdhD [Aurantimonas sp. MSK8Z-1]|uniref:formate dehydrogenase accessory sulfurtransferase FdhD n=1 Tax=Mangrovibrevibacter kandeliae TaxID=2968473 RepID=UPI0021194553|nr:formate dehydrogenase accessory sulfurtransferase FdhD [Aurantimonas sp. MSK8Z-1]MCW4116140.1 formate dehydrogenase accessory sulfurtransferase FdhD [Aurantimonas sp. MSK8Z-1]
MTDVAVGTTSLAFSGGAFVRRERAIPAETAVAISVNGSSHAVMMATPEHLDELALGLALNERIVEHPREIERLEIAPGEAGIDCRLWLTEARSASYVARRRQMTGPVGCGLCGVESLELAQRPLPRVDDGLVVTPADLTAAMAAMARAQGLGQRTRAVHAAAFHTAGQGLVVTREDVGRHNALDKVAGHLAAGGIAGASGFVTITSRVSVELIQKAAFMGVPLIAAVSVPTALAVAEAERANVSLVAVLRGEEFEIFTGYGRIAGAADALVHCAEENSDAA